MDQTFVIAAIYDTPNALTACFTLSSQAPWMSADSRPYIKHGLMTPFGIFFVDRAKIKTSLYLHSVEHAPQVVKSIRDK
jgi:hypothetical protein